MTPQSPVRAEKLFSQIKPCIGLYAHAIQLSKFAWTYRIIIDIPVDDNLSCVLLLVSEIQYDLRGLHYVIKHDMAWHIARLPLE